ncbi:MAG: hypothetical protein GXY36_13435 [Chloroflexi bacterium]|jgi:hypothetical protein|nr:hypothetical protein [Chloroflexota bacterium]
MTAAKVWQILIGAVCVICLLLSQGSAASQTDYGTVYSIAWRSDGMQVAYGDEHGMLQTFPVSSDDDTTSLPERR